MVGTAVLRGKSLAEARALCSANCVTVDRAVSYLGWYGSLHQFQIISQRFARDFMLANQSKLVNLSPEAQNILGANNPSGGNTPRAAHRYIN
ncbi:MAG TPA: hypothetical protein VE994_10520, partial [Terriglobales bacterium]|nr:hypothetical protein [Terriglobales bacterium]